MNRIAAIPLHYLVAGALGAFVLGNTLVLLVQELAHPGVALGFADKDFANYWTAGRLILEGRTADLFGPQPVYFAHLVEAFGADYPWHNWSYPPHYLLMVWPLGLFGYKAAMLLFLAVTGLFFAWAVRRFAGGGPLVWLAVLPFVAHNVWVAQNGFLFAGLGLGALALRAERPVLAGIMLGVLTVKPQLGILFPLLLLVERRWVAIASAAVTTLALVALSAAVFGVDAWRGYLSVVVPYQTLVMRELGGTFLTMMPSVYGSLRNWDWGADPALAVHMLVAVPVVLATIAALFLARRDRDRATIVLVAVFLVTPYALTYDLGLLAAAAAVMAARLPAPERSAAIWLSLAMMLPVIMMPLGAWGLSVAPLVLLAAWLIALRLARVPQRMSAFLRLRRGVGRGAAVPA